MCGGQEQTIQEPVQISVTRHEEESAENTAQVLQPVEGLQIGMQQDLSAVSDAHTAAVNPESLSQAEVTRTLNMQRVQIWPPATKRNDGLWEVITRYFDNEFENIGRIAEEYNAHLDREELEKAGALRTRLLSACMSYLHSNSIQRSQRENRTAYVENMICDLLVDRDVQARAEEHVQTAIDGFKVNVIASHVKHQKDYPLNDRELHGAERLRRFLNISLDPQKEADREMKTSQVQRTLITRIFADNSFAAPMAEQLRKANAPYDPQDPEKMEHVQSVPGKVTCAVIGNTTNLYYNQDGQAYGISGAGLPESDDFRHDGIIGSFLHELTHSADLLTYQNSMLTLGFPRNMRSEDIAKMSQHRLAILNRAKSLIDSASSIDAGLKVNLLDRLNYMGLEDKARTQYFSVCIGKANNNSTAGTASSPQKDAWSREKAQLEQYRSIQNDQDVNFTVFNEYDACMPQCLHYIESAIPSAELEGTSETAQIYRLFKAAALETVVFRDQYIRSRSDAAPPPQPEN